MTRRSLGLVALLVLAASGPACGKYGKPVRTATRAPAAAVGAQPAAATPDAEACEQEAAPAETPAP